MELLNLIGAGLVGALGAQALQYARERLLEGDRRKPKFRLASAVLAADLDKFSYICADVISTNDTVISSRGNACKWECKIPELILNLDIVDISTIPAQLLSDLLTFSLKRNLAEARVDSIAYFGTDEAEVAEEASLQCAVCGTDAIELSDRLRSLSGLPKPNYKTFGCDFTEELTIYLRKNRTKAME